MKRKMAFVDLTNFKDWPMGGMLEYELAILPYLAEYYDLDIWGYSLNGVILSTVISVLAVGMPWILHNLFTVLFKRNAWEYIRKLLYYTIVTTIVCTLTYLVASQIPGVGILALILKAIVSVIVSNLLMFVAYFKMGEFAEVKKLVIRVLKRQA